MSPSVASSHPTALLEVDTKYSEEWYVQQVKAHTRNLSITEMQEAESYAYKRHNEKHDTHRDSQSDSNYFFYWAELHNQLEKMQTKDANTVSSGPWPTGSDGLPDFVS
jgi:hypothetical protein